MSNRSRHMLNLKLSYAEEKTGISGSVRLATGGNTDLWKRTGQTTF
jgi:hypothetical protein